MGPARLARIADCFVFLWISMKHRKRIFVIDIDLYIDMSFMK